MNPHALTAAFGWLAVGASLVSTVAQWRRVSHEGIEGVSLATWSLFTMMGGFWIAYGLAAGSWPVVLGSLVVLPLQAAILFRLAPWRAWRTVGWSMALFATTCLMPAVIGGWSAGVYGIGVAMVLTRGPQLLELVREADASGVSTASWTLGAVGSILWVTYYDGDHLWAALVATSAAGLANLTIATLAAWRHRQARRTIVRDEVFAY